MLDQIVSTVGAATYDRKGLLPLECGILAVAIVGAVATVALTLTADLTNPFDSIAMAITTAVAKAGGGV